MSETTTPGESGRLADVGFHDGEVAVQQQAGTRQEAARLSPMLEPAELRGGIVAFLADRTFAVITARDAGTARSTFTSASSPGTIPAWPAWATPGGTRSSPRATPR
jgi:hypothetical protein